MSAWAELGQQLDHPLTAEEAMKAGSLAGWNVRKVPMWATLPPVKGISQQVEVTDRVAVVRDSPHTARQTDYLSIVSHSYTVVQNEAYAPALDQLAGDSGATFALAGELDGGRSGFLSLQLPGHMDGGVEVYVTALNDHGGYRPWTLLVTPVHSATGTVLAVEEVARVRHTPNAAEAASEEARAALDRMFTYLEHLQRTIVALDATPLSQPEFEHLVDRHFGAPLDAGRATRTRRRAQRDELSEMFAAREGDTAWDGWTTLADWFDHRSPVRGDTSRAYKAIFEPGFKERALRVMEGVS
jgi:phage/plasmid-like protein (TIGR03299 family)